MTLLKDRYPILERDTDPHAIIDLTHKGELRCPERAVMAFLGEELIARYVLDHGGVQIGCYESITKMYPIFEFESGETSICLCQAPVGSAASVQILEYLIAGGAKKIIAVGSCGVLEEMSENLFLIPTCALRDEGTSYHYLPPSREIEICPAGVRAVEEALMRQEIPWQEVKTWSTDAFFRETEAMTAYRREEGCQVVEMECSALAACAAFRGAEFAMLLFTADTLANPAYYEERNFGKESQIPALELAVEAVKLL